ncbi:penta EF hand calcium binding protein [Heterostelium album PN500]|uniref:Penta EF hand calcium binding protein n=1 Tax=Heterostelium pallidum (strain ATCC 26659 / Pp 5 / PN500) TaxID=670386 RepID=D3BAA5_HETP5|nr:penta EF hand calcium binding protein [Heterostelium album PN500]EFA81492.1 penta EF hand calcium binding protein [Heterostelium album PN500]|eukprot:XP_020433610.1 penta EF hand calcium binding protein [Heterostelium album PN500]
MYFQAQPMMTTVVQFQAPVVMQGMWYYNLYAQLQQQQLMEMNAWFISMDRDRSGTISSHELQYLVIGGTPLGIDTANKLIRCFDRNRNGQIDFYEYAALHAFINHLYRCFAANDRNFSGTIDVREIYSALASAGFSLPFQTVNLYFMKYSPTGAPLLFTQYLNLCASVALTRSLFEWSDPMRTGMIHITLQQLFDMFALA